MNLLLQAGARSSASRRASHGGDPSSWEHADGSLEQEDVLQLLAPGLGPSLSTEDLPNISAVASAQRHSAGAQPSEFGALANEKAPLSQYRIYLRLTQWRRAHS